MNDGLIITLYVEINVQSYQMIIVISSKPPTPPGSGESRID